MKSRMVQRGIVGVDSRILSLPLDHARKVDMAAEPQGEDWPGLQVREDMPFQRKQWFIQRCGWILVALFVLAGVLGVFGGGPLSRSVKEEGGLRVEYERFLRAHAPTRLVIVADNGHAADGSLKLWLGQDLLRRVQIDHIMPAPRSAQAGGDGVLLTFLADKDAETARVDFFLQPRDMGRFEGTFGIVDGPRITISGFSFP